MADFKPPPLEFGPEFERNGSNESEIFNEGSSNPLETIKRFKWLEEAYFSN